MVVNSVHTMSFHIYTCFEYC